MVKNYKIVCSINSIFAPLNTTTNYPMPKSIVFIILLCYSNQSFGQQPRLGLEAGLIISMPLTSVTGLPAPGAFASLSYAPIKLGHVSVDYSIGKLWGAGKMTSDIETSNSSLGKNTFNFNTSYSLFSFNGFINLHHVFKSRKLAQRYIPYLHVGAGSLEAVSTAENETLRNSKTYHQKYFTTTYGILVKVKLNPKFDWSFRANVNLTETKYLDAIFYDKKYDAFINLIAGLVYYPGATKKRNYVAWQPYKKICPKSLAF